MNQDLRRMAEEVELPEPAYRAVPYTKVPGESVSEPQDFYSNTQVREAIAAALVKLTQQEPVECEGCKGSTVRGFKRGVRCAECKGTGYTLLIPSQQEERKPLTSDSGFCPTCGNDLTKAY